MNSRSSNRFSISERGKSVLLIAGLLVLLWVARYLRFDQFGLYEDDITNIPGAIVMSGRELVEYNLAFVSNLYGKGHPLHFVLLRSFSWIGWRLGGLPALYIIGFTIVSFSIILYYLLVRRVWGHEIAVFAGIFFALYSADTTQAFLTHSLELFPSMVFLLIAFHAYLSNREPLAYLSIVLALVTYETTFLVFLAAPLLGKHNFGRMSGKEILRHLIVLGIILAAVVFVRVSTGDGRIAELQGASIILTPIRHMIVGTAVSTGSYLLRAVQVLTDLQLVELAALVILFPAVLFTFDRVRPDPHNEGSAVDSTTRFESPESTSRLQSLADSMGERWRRLESEKLRLFSVLATAILLIVLAYPLTFTTRSFSISGRETRVHFAAAPGVALLWGAGINAFRSARSRKWVRWAGLSLVALVLPLTLFFGFRLQRDYAVAWKMENQFWSDLIPLISDASNGDVVIVDPGVFDDVEQIGANTWNLPSVLTQLYKFPDSWKQPPVVYRMLRGWASGLAAPNGDFVLNNLTVTAPGSYYREVPTSAVIFVDHDGDGNMVRMTEIEINGQLHQLKERSDADFTDFNTGLLFEIMDLQSTNH